MPNLLMIPPATITGQLRYSWLDPTNVLRDLNRDVSPSRWVIAGSVGLGDAEFAIVDTKFPSAEGSYINQINTQPRRISLPIIVYATDLGALTLLCEDLYSWFETGDETSKTPGYLKITRPDDTIRQIAAYRTGGGFTGDMKEGGTYWTRYIVELYCPDPYPQADADTVVIKTTGYDNFAEINQGRLPAYPIWKLNGPFTNFLIDNATAGFTIVGTVTIALGHYLIVDTRPSEFRSGYSVYDDTGANRQSVITPGSEFGPMRVGANTLGVAFGGSTGSTSVQLTYRKRYRALLR